MLNIDETKLFEHINCSNFIKLQMEQYTVGEYFISRSEDVRMLLWYMHLKKNVKVIEEMEKLK